MADGNDLNRLEMPIEPAMVEMSKHVVVLVNVKTLPFIQHNDTVVVDRLLLYKPFKGCSRKGYCRSTICRFRYD
jgi:hypothetical protein